jgi:hypothetical protein
MPSVFPVIFYCFKESILNMSMRHQGFILTNDIAVLFQSQTHHIFLQWIVDGSKKQDIQKTSMELYDFNRKRFDRKTLTSKFDVNLVVY